MHFSNLGKNLRTIHMERCNDTPTSAVPTHYPTSGTHPSPDDDYIKSICPSGGHGRGHRLALQNRAAARHVPLTVNIRLGAGRQFGRGASQLTPTNKYVK